MHTLSTKLLTASLLAAIGCLSLAARPDAAADVEKAFQISGEDVGPEGLPLPGEGEGRITFHN